MTYVISYSYVPFVFCELLIKSHTAITKSNTESARHSSTALYFFCETLLILFFSQDFTFDLHLLPKAFAVAVAATPRRRSHDVHECNKCTLTSLTTHSATSSPISRGKAAKSTATSSTDGGMLTPRRSQSAAAARTTCRTLRNTNRRFSTPSAADSTHKATESKQSASAKASEFGTTPTTARRQSTKPVCYGGSTKPTSSAAFLSAVRTSPQSTSCSVRTSIDSTTATNPPGGMSSPSQIALASAQSTKPTHTTSKCCTDAGRKCCHSRRRTCQQSRCMCMVLSRNTACAVPSSPTTPSTVTRTAGASCRSSSSSSRRSTPSTATAAPSCSCKMVHRPIPPTSLRTISADLSLQTANSGPGSNTSGPETHQTLIRLKASGISSNSMSAHPHRSAPSAGRSWSSASTRGSHLTTQPAAGKHCEGCRRVSDRCTTLTSRHFATEVSVLVCVCVSLFLSFVIINFSPDCHQYFSCFISISLCSCAINVSISLCSCAMHIK